MQTWDIGGQDRIRPLWRHYFNNTNGLIYVEDSNDRERASEAKEELQRLCVEEELAGCAAVVTASTAWGVTMGTRSAGLEMEPRRRGDLIIVPVRMYASSKSRRSLPVARGPITRVALAPRINGPLTEHGRVVICKRGAYCCGTLVYHPWVDFLADPAPSVRIGPARVSWAREAAAVPREVRGVSAASVRARVAGGGEDV